MPMTTQHQGRKPRWFLLVALFLLLLAGGVFRPQPAQAQCCGDGVVACSCIQTQTGVLSGILSGIFVLTSGILTVLVYYIKLFNEKMGTLIATSATSGSIRDTVQYLTLQAQQEHNLDLARAQVVTQAGMANNIHPKARLGACISYSLNLGVMIARGAKGGTSEQLLRGVMGRFLGPKADGDGAKSAGMHRAMRCPPKTSIHANDPPTWNPAHGEPPDECKEWVDSSGKFTDADLSAATLSGKVLEKPQMVAIPGYSGVKPPMAPQGNGSDEQKLWIAAMRYCYTAAGPRPTPPSNESLKTSDGILAAAQFDHCAALESAFIKQCTDRVAKFTRPDCNMVSSDGYAENKELCDSSYRICQQAKKVISDFKSANLSEFKCDQEPPSLSPFQAEYLGHLACATEDRAIKEASATPNMAALMGNSDVCNLSMAAWKTQLASEENSFVAGMLGLQQLRSCWGGVRATKRAEAMPDESATAKKASARAERSAGDENHARALPISSPAASLPDAIVQ